MPDSPSVRSLSPRSPAQAEDHNDHGASKTGKDRACPFCHQPFTSSSLGRHLDLYIKPINPKPPDGVHNVAKIREMRGKITRRQPRGSLRKSEIPQEDVDPMIEADAPHDGSVVGEHKRQRLTDHGSPASSSLSQVVRVAPQSSHRNGIGGSNWQGTGVIPGLPVHTANMDRFSTARSAYLGADPTRSFLTGPTSQVASPRPTVTTVESSEAEELSRAAQAALHEVLDSLDAARAAYTPVTLFDFDYFAETFPGLCLRLLPSPRTIWSTTPFASPETWPISPPGEEQKTALRKVIDARGEAIGQHHHRGSEWQQATRHLDYAYREWKELGDDEERARTWHLEVLRTYSRSQRLLGERTAELRLAKQQAEYFRRQCELVAPRASATARVSGGDGDVWRAVGEPLAIPPEAFERLEGQDADRRAWSFDGLIEKWRGRMRDEQKSAAADAVEAVENASRVKVSAGQEQGKGGGASAQSPSTDKQRKPESFLPVLTGLSKPWPSGQSASQEQQRQQQQREDGPDQSWLDGAEKAVKRVIQRQQHGGDADTGSSAAATATSDSSPPGAGAATNGYGTTDDGEEGREVNEHGKRSRPLEQ